MKLYLDSQIFSNLSSFENLPKEEDVKVYRNLNNLISSLRDQIIIPYSNTHLDDLMKSYKQGQNERVSKSLAFISSLTQNVCLVQYWNEEHATWHYRDPFEFFNSKIEDETTGASLDNIHDKFKEYGIDKAFEPLKSIPHGFDFKQMQDHAPAFASMFPRAQNEGTAYAAVMDILDLTTQLQTNPSAYLELRNWLRTSMNLDPNISNFGNVIKQLDEYLPKTMLNKSFTELYADTNKKDYLKNKNYSKITGIYMQLDMVGYRPDKMNDKNGYDNMLHDAFHCFYGAHCDYFITADKICYKKSKAIYQSENITTPVMKPQEFLEHLAK